MSRHVAVKDAKKPITDGDEVGKALMGSEYDDDFPPDLFVLGRSTTMLNGVSKESQQANPELGLLRLFYEPGMAPVVSVDNDIAFGVGLSTLMAALDCIQLGKMPWFPILEDVLQKKNM